MKQKPGKEKMIVVRDGSGLEKKITKKTLVVQVDTIENAVPAFGKWSSENRVFCVVVHEEKPLAEIELSEELKIIPLALFLKDGGAPKTIIEKSREFREANITLYLPAHNPENFTLLQILASLDVACGVYLENEAKPVNWDSMNDLMYYAAYSPANHARVEPFDYAVSNYDPQEYLCFTTPWFENPRRFFYMDENENIALSRKKMEEGDFVATGISSFDSLDDNEKYKEHLTMWTNQFIDNQRCASCPAWRVCGGAFVSICESNPNYFQFFNDLLEAAEQNRVKQEQDTEWRL